MLKEFFVKQQLKKMGVTDDQLGALMKVVKDNPGLFQKLGQEIETKVSHDKIGYQEATLAIVQKHQTELAQIFEQK